MQVSIIIIIYNGHSSLWTRLNYICMDILNKILSFGIIFPFRFRKSCKKITCNNIITHSRNILIPSYVIAGKPHTHTYIIIKSSRKIIFLNSVGCFENWATSCFSFTRVYRNRCRTVVVTVLVGLNNDESR